MTDTAHLDGASFTLTGAMRIADPARTAVRGDLAHIALAGRYFVPHYAVPLARVVGAAGADLLSASRADADVIARLDPAETFDVLDVAGGYAWGQCCDSEGGEGGLVGYVALGQLAP